MVRQICRAILATAGAVLLAVFLVVLGSLYQHYSEEQEEHLRTDLQLAARGVELLGQRYFDALSLNGYRLTWIAHDGSVLHDTEAAANTLPNHAHREEVHDALVIGEGFSARYSETMLERTVNQATKLRDGTVLRISAEQLTPLALVFNLGGTLLLMLALAAGLSVVLARHMAGELVEPLNTLNLDAPLTNDVYEEITPLLHRIYQQQRSLKVQYRQIQAQTEEFALVSQGMQEGLVLLDDRAIVLAMNPAARALFAVDDSDVKGREFHTIDRTPELTAAIKAALAEGRAQLRLQRRGREYQFDLSRTVTHDRPSGVVMLALDITEQAAAEQQRREFTANVSHELKTPLQSIMGSAELLAGPLVAAEDVPRFVQHIRAEAARLMALIDDILRLSQLDEGTAFNDAEVNLRDVAAEVIAGLRAQAAAKGVAVALSGGDLVVKGERGLLAELVCNLVDNAIKYNVEGGRVAVTLRDRTLTVADTGIGIPAEYRQKVFERFFRVDKSRSKASGGTGLGLSIVKHAAAHHHATIALTSELGKGTSVAVTF